MMYWEPVKNMYVREIYKTVPFDPGPTFEDWKKQQDCAANPKGEGCGQRGGGGNGARGGRGAAPAPVIDASNPIWVAIQGAPAAGRGAPPPIRTRNLAWITASPAIHICRRRQSEKLWSILRFATPWPKSTNTWRTGSPEAVNKSNQGNPQDSPDPVDEEYFF